MKILKLFFVLLLIDYSIAEANIEMEAGTGFIFSSQEITSGSGADRDIWWNRIELVPNIGMYSLKQISDVKDITQLTSSNFKWGAFVPNIGEGFAVKIKRDNKTEYAIIRILEISDNILFQALYPYCGQVDGALPSQCTTDCNQVTEIPHIECEALIALYNSTNGPNWSDSPDNNWNITDTPCSNWAGITCGGGHVTRIDRNTKNLTGSIPNWSALTKLQSLSLVGNQLTGSIPDWSALTSLQFLYLNSNHLTGSIPDWSTLTSLRGIYLHDGNHLTGSIPDWSTLTSLQQISLGGNQLTGSIPDWSMLISLVDLNLYNNQLTGSIPDYSALTKLRSLYLYSNYLTGSIPDLSTLTNLKYLRLENNQLISSIPTSLISLTNLTDLNLSYNQLTAQDPALLTFLNSKAPDWALTQTIPPTNLQATSLSENSIEISWTPILYTNDGGYYQVKYATTPGGPYTSAATTTANKSATSYVVTDLSPNTTYSFVVETYTPAHGFQKNKLTSVLSVEVSATTLSSTSPPPVTPPPPPVTPPPVTPPPPPVTPSPPPVTPPPPPVTPPPPPVTPPPPPVTPPPPPVTPIPATMNLTVSFSGNGHGRVTTNPSGIDCDSNQAKCFHSFNTATWVKLQAIAAADSQFIRWFGNRSDCEDGELFMTEPSACVADFRLLRFPLTVTIVGQGQVSSKPIGIHCSEQCQSFFDIGTNITLTALPEKGWQFQEWRGDCDKTGTVVIKANQACQATFVQLPSDLPPIDNAILTACDNAIPWDGQANETAVVKNTGTLNLVGSLTPIKIKALCNYGTIQEIAGKLLSIRVNPRVGFIYNEGQILGKDGNSSTAKSTIPTHLVNEGDNGSSIKLKAGIQFYNQGLIQAGAGGNGYLTAGRGGSVEIYANQIIQAGSIAAGNGGEGNAHQPEWDGVWESETFYGNQAVWGGQGGKTLLHAKQSLHATMMATTSSGMGGNAYVWCRNGAYLIDWWFDGRWYAGTCVSDNSKLPVAIPTPGKGGDLIQLSPALYDLSQASSGKGLYYEPSTITLSTETRLQAQEDILIFGGNDWVLDLRHLSVGAISTPGNITLVVGKNGIVDLRGNTDKIFQAGGQFTVLTDTLWLDEGISLADLVAAPAGIVTHPSKIIYQVILNGPEQITGEPQTTLPIELELINSGPEADVYYLTVSDSASWNLSTLPSPIAVAGLGHETLQLNVTLPTTVDEQDAITITATSAAEPSVTSSTQIGVKVVEDPTQSATTTVEINKPPIITDNLANVAANNDEPVTTVQEELPQLTESDSSTLPAADPFSSLPPQTPSCYASGLVDWVCNAQGQIVTDLIVGPNGMIANGTLVGTLTNQGWVSNLTLEPHSRLTGGIVTGYITNHGEMADFEFRGAAIVGGVLAGQITNTSFIGGYFRDVQLAAGTHLLGGQVVGKISGDAQAPALLEDLEIQAGSYLEYVMIGEGVELATPVTWGEGVQFSHPSDDPRLVSK